MARSGELPTICLAVAFALTLSRTASAGQVPLALDTPADRPAADSTLRTFIIDKPIESPQAARLASHPTTAYRLPPGRDTVRATLGAGYVQGADWGTEIMAGGGVAGTQVQLNALVTRGREGLVLDQGAISIFDPDAQWRVEAGD